MESQYLSNILNHNSHTIMNILFLIFVNAQPRNLNDLDSSNNDTHRALPATTVWAQDPMISLKEP